MEIALAQLNFTVGDIRGNTKKITGTIKKTKADIIVFPELSVTGYSPQDLLLDGTFVEENLDALGRISKSSINKAAVVGFAESANGSLYNSAAVVENGQLLKVHRKICLPNYSTFDEKRWFKEGANATIFECCGRKIGLSICEDIWFPEATKTQKANGAGLILNISASPYGKGKIEAVEKVLRQRWKENKIPIVYVNQVGAQDGIIYYGHSLYFAGGKAVNKCKDFEEDTIIIDIK